MNELKNSIDFEVPKLSGSRASPASVESVTLYKSSDTEAKMRITIRRLLRIPLESFTFMYRFSKLPPEEFDSRHPFHSYVYTDPDMNSSELLTFNGTVPSKMKFDGCTAFVSEVRLTDGRVITYRPEDYNSDDEELIEDLITRGAPLKEQPEPEIISEEPPSDVSDAQDAEAAETTEPQAESEPVRKYHDKPDSTNSDEAKKKARRGRLTVALTVLFFSIIIEVIAGVYIFRYSNIKHTAQTLMSESRFNEAYKLVSDNSYRGLLQKVCETASEYYSENGSLEQAYVFAAGAPEPFTDKIIDLAASKVVDHATGEINENAYRVAKMADDDGKFATIVRSIVNMLCSKEDFANALRVASELRSENERQKTENEVFNNAVKRFMSSHEFERLISFIDELSEVRTFSVTEKQVADAIISYCDNSGDSSGLIYFSTKYPSLIDLSNVNVTIKPDDSGVRAALDVVWELLSEPQKRAYHSREIALYKEFFRIKNGKIEGTDITDAVSVDTYEYHTIVLHKSGSVSAIENGEHNMKEVFPTSNDVIQIAAGLEHSVMLHADGTVTAVGSNRFGQCNVDGWEDICAVAAGQSFTLGLKTDGTVVAVGSNLSGQCDVSGYRNVCAIACGSQTSVLLFRDGTVALQGYRSLGLSDATKVTGVKSVRAASTAVLLMLEDGSFRLFDGSGSTSSFGDPYNWRNIVDYDVGSVCIAAVDSSGALYVSGDNFPDK